jgi:hypothetical protein
MVPKNYKKLGKLPEETIDFFKYEVIKRKLSIPYQWVFFDDYLSDKFMEIFSNKDLKIKYDEKNKRFVQKYFVSEPNHGWRIHKDGINDSGALNIIITCNETDWVRWYNEDYINMYCIMNNIPIKTVKNNKGSSRNTDIFDYDNLSFVEELTEQQPGDVYVVETNNWHSFKCVGQETRIIIQTKFEEQLSCDEIYETLSKNSFRNIKKNE